MFRPWVDVDHTRLFHKYHHENFYLKEIFENWKCHVIVTDYVQDYVYLELRNNRFTSFTDFYTIQLIVYHLPELDNIFVYHFFHHAEPIQFLYVINQLNNSHLVEIFYNVYDFNHEFCLDKYYISNLAIYIFLLNQKLTLIFKTT